MSMVADQPVAEPARTAADRFMRRLLRVDRAEPTSAAAARKAMQTSVAFSGARCLLTYIVFPFVLPLIGLATGVGLIIGAVIGVLAIVNIVISMRRFWRSDHRSRWAYTAFGSAMMAFLVVLTVLDVVAAV